MIQTVVISQQLMSGKSMDDESFEAVCRQELQQAENYIDSVLSPERAAATKYFTGEPFGDEEDGRSKVVSRDVHDTVMRILPDLVRVFFGSERIVEFTPKGEEDAAFAAQATDYAQWVIQEQNSGVILFWNVFQDALIRRTGIFKVWADESVEVEEREYTGIGPEELLALQNDPEIEIKELSAEENGLIEVTAVRRKKSVRIRVDSVPPEEIVWNASARDFNSARLVAHRTKKTSSDLIAMGYTPEQIEESASNSSALDRNEERITRQWEAGSTHWKDDAADPSMKEYDYAELFLKVDYDGDGIAELRKVCMIGASVVHNEMATKRPFAVLSPYPEPHVAGGRSVADCIMDIQRIKSQIQRLMMDSLAQSIIQRYGVVDGQANMDDVLDTRVGAPIRMRAPGMVQPFSVPFEGAKAFGMLQYLDDVLESRVGVSKASEGLAADVLQSTTKTAVQAHVDAATAQKEMIARIFAETGIKDLYKLILDLATTHQDRETIIRLRGQFVKMDPRQWDPSMDVSIAVGLGGGTREERVNTLRGIAEKQEAILQTLGPSNPLVSLDQYSYTLRQLASLSGFPDASKFFNPVAPDWQPPQTQPQQDPQQQAALIVAQAQREQTQADIAKKKGELELKAREMEMTDARERYRIEAETRVRLAELQLKYGADMHRTAAEIEAQNVQIQQQEPIQ